MSEVTFIKTFILRSRNQSSFVVFVVVIVCLFDCLFILKVFCFCFAVVVSQRPL